MDTRGLFSRFDTTESKTLNSGQFFRLLLHVQERIPKDLSDSIFAYTDTDCDGFITYPEFRKLWLSEPFAYFLDEGGSVLTKAHRLFKRYTPDPTMNIDQFSRLLVDQSIRYTEEEFDNLDLNDDGRLNFYEFCRWLSWF